MRKAPLKSRFDIQPVIPAAFDAAAAPASSMKAASTSLSLSMDANGSQAPSFVMGHLSSALGSHAPVGSSTAPLLTALPVFQAVDPLAPVMAALASPAPQFVAAPSIALPDQLSVFDTAPVASATPTALLDANTSMPGVVTLTDPGPVPQHIDAEGFTCSCPACTGSDLPKPNPVPPTNNEPMPGDDIADDISSTTTLAVGSSLTSAINTSGDKDYVKVSLVAGQTYTFSLGGGSLVDGYVELRNSANTLLAQDDDGGIRYDSFLMFRPTVSGDYFVVARDYSTGTGTYTLAVNSIPQGNTSPTSFTDNGKAQFSWDESAIQITRTGSSWASTFSAPAVVTYAFRSTAPTTMPSDTAGFTRFSATQIAAAEAALQAWSSVANITFVRVGSGTSGEGAFSNSASILFSNYATGASGAAAFAYLPSTGNTAASSVEGDIWINSSLSYNANPVLGDYGPHVLLHEIGHALGLSHPGDYNAGAGSPTYPTSAVYFGDSRMFTSMSYFASSSTGGNLSLYPSQPQIHDIAAIQRLYGANTATRTGDTVYGFNSNTGLGEFTIGSEFQGVVMSIWDGGGIDTLDLSGYSTNATIDLRPESFTTAGPSGAGISIYNISIAKGTIIENAIGGLGDDTINGNTADNTLNGGAGNDTLNGNEGNDTFIGGFGSDTLNGGTGSDTANYADTTLGVTVNLTLATNQATGSQIGTDQLNSIENVTGGSGADTLTGDAGNNVIVGNAGNDTITLSSGGDDTVQAGGDSDIIIMGAAFTAADTLDGGSGTDTLRLDGNYSAGITLGAATIAGIETIELAAGNSYRLTFNNANVASGQTLSINGSALLAATTMNIDGSAETDGSFDIAGGAGNDTFNGGSGNDNLTGNAGNDFMQGRAGADTLDGGANDDWLDGGTGADTIIGGLGTDVAAYGASTAAVSLDLQAGTYTGGDATGDVLSGIEGLSGSGFNDNLFGDGNANRLFGQGGNDFMQGRAGADLLDGGNGDDWLDGGAGADQIFGGAGIDVAAYGASTAAVSLDLQAGTYTGGDATGDVLSGIEGLSGSGFNDNLFGDGNANRLFGQGGNDFIQGRAGADLLDGGNGDDWLDGGTGADTITGGAGIDVAAYGASTSAVSLDLQAGTYSGGEATGDVLSGIEGLSGSGFNDNLFGDAGVNRLFGQGGNDFMQGRGGADYIDGGNGDDWLDGGSGADTIIGGAGTNDVSAYGASTAAVSLDLQAGTYTGGDATGDVLSGIEGLSGSGFGDTLRGDAGVNRLFGQGGNDTLDGRGGNDVLTGGNGDDIFFFTDAGGTDQIVDFDALGNDVIRLNVTGISTFADVQSRMTQVGTDVVIDFDTTDIVLSNTTLASMGADDFTFGPFGG